MVVDFSIQFSPIEVLEVRKTRENEYNLEVLTRWSEGTPDSTTWEQATLFQEQFYEFHLEDKVALGGGVMIDPRRNHVFT